MPSPRLLSETSPHRGGQRALLPTAGKGGEALIEFARKVHERGGALGFGGGIRAGDIFQRLERQFHCGSSPVLFSVPESC